MTIDLTTSDNEDDEDGARSDVEEAAKENKQMAQFAKALLSSNTMAECGTKCVEQCDGSDAQKTLRWLRALDEVNHPVGIARLAAAGPLIAFVKRKKPNIDWTQLRQKVAERIVSTAFQQIQQDALEKLVQRSGESLVKFNHEFEMLIRKAYDTLPTDQKAL